MGGICGIVNLDGAPLDPQYLPGMIEAMAYRGVDGIHAHLTPTTAFAHFAHHTTPISAQSHQPLIHAPTGVTLVADGRLFNRQTLITQLSSEQVGNDPDPTDCELILGAYLKWGVDSPGHLIGDFAFVVWDERIRQVLCVRAPFGTRSLHYTQQANYVAFATDAAPLLSLPEVTREPDLLSLLKGATVCQTEDDGRGFFRDIQWLPRSNALTVTSDRARCSPYWTPDSIPPIRYRSDDQYGEHLRHLLTAIMEDGVQSDLSLMGIMISGGMDSTTIAALAKPILDRAGKRLIAYNFYKQTPPAYDERPLVHQLESALDLEVRYIEIEPYFLTLPQMYDLTFAELPTTTIMRLPAEGVDHLRESGGKVMLAGFGGDYFFAGPSLPPHLHQLLRGNLGVLRRFWRAVPNRPQSLSQQFLGTFVKPLLEVAVCGQKARASFPQWIPRDSPLRAEFEAHWQGRWEASRQFSPAQSLYNSVWQRSGMRDSLLLNERLYADRGIELRLPLTDQRLAQFILAIPPEQLYCFGERKAVLRRAVQGLVPEAIRTQKKLPAPDYFQPWAQQMSRQFMSLFAPSILGTMRVVDDKVVRELLEHYTNTGEQGGYFYLHWLCGAELWMRKWVQQMPAPA